jgi:citronellol/citronellal dehydrogenase
VQNLLDGDEMVRRSRKQEIVADVAYAILTRDSRSCTGNFFIDEDVLREECITDVASYQLAESEEALEIDIFLNA